jgi:surface antigen
LGSLFGKDGDTDVTGAVRAADPGSPSDQDLGRVKAAAMDLLNRGQSGMSQPWESPHSGARGTVTLLAPSQTDQPAACRHFLASYVRDGSETWLHGEACRSPGGPWQVHSIGPWKRP